MQKSALKPSSSSRNAKPKPATKKNGSKTPKIRFSLRPDDDFDEDDEDVYRGGNGGDDRDEYVQEDNDENYT
ncbi:hypothetical protein EON65_07040 [archaeon]|nr:MAG: hypothetical protein EON65_07040 [archaeon]